MKSREWNGGNLENGKRNGKGKEKKVSERKKEGIG